MGSFYSSVLFAQADSRRMFGQGTPFQITDLPQQSRLRNRLERLLPKAKQQALKKLHEFSFPENDATVIEVDTNGDIYYIDAEHPPAIAQAEVVSSLPAAPAPVLTLPAIDVFKLHSKSGSSKVVYLDFDGHVITGTAWNNTSGVLTYTAKAFDFDFNPSSFSLNERESIHEIWHRIAEDYAPFDIDVTTEQPTHFGSKVGRVLFTSSVDQNGTPMPSSTGGGVAYINAFGLSNYATFYSPAFVYADNLGPNHAPFMAEAGAHEFGHNLGLSHDGVLNQSVNTVCPSTAVYYCGLGNGSVSWAPIMGTSYYANVTQWSKGEYFSANNTQDDLAVIQNKLGYRNDDHGNVIANASPLIVDSTGAISVTTPQNDPSNSLSSNKGIIETSTDVDVYSFDAAAGSVTFTVTPAWTAFTRTGLNYLQYRGANLDIQATLYNAAGAIVANDLLTDTKATLSTTLSAAGRYYLSVNSVGNTITPYSTYNSMGGYFISGTVVPQTSTHVREDYNSDGKADVLWRNSNTGANYLYFVNGATFTEAAVNTLSTDWQIQGKGDYNAYGKADILWRNSTTGVNYIYQMNGSAYTEAYLDTVPVAWEVAGRGAVNADGRAA
ncbi:MAG: zinc-dependent metalloprotease family protein, partial [Methylococcales bacterium]